MKRMKRVMPAMRMMRRLCRLWLWRLCLVLLLCAGCGWGATPIERVVHRPARYQARPLTVRGTVVWAGYLPDVGSRGFELEQGGARLLVLSSRSSPAVGKPVRVSGHLEMAFELGDRCAPVLLDEGPGPGANGGAADVR